MLQNPQLHYLDNAATTIVAPEVADVIDKAMREHWANPSSLYGPGARSEEALNAARAAVARTLGCKSRELYFTSCGSESNNLALLGAVQTHTFSAVTLSAFNVTNGTDIGANFNLMSVQLRLPNNTMVRIPNEIIIKNPVSNITRFSTRRCDLSLGVDYNCDIEHVVNVLREVVKQNKFCLDDPAPLISFSGFQDSSLGFTVGAWCRKDNFLDCQKTLAHDIKRRFEEEGISFPFPTRSLESRSPIKVEISGPPEKNQ